MAAKLILVIFMMAAMLEVVRSVPAEHKVAPFQGDALTENTVARVIPKAGEDVTNWCCPLNGCTDLCGCSTACWTDGPWCLCY